MLIQKLGCSFKLIALFSIGSVEHLAAVTDGHCNVFHGKKLSIIFDMIIIKKIKNYVYQRLIKSILINLRLDMAQPN